MLINKQASQITHSPPSQIKCESIQNNKLPSYNICGNKDYKYTTLRAVRDNSCSINAAASYQTWNDSRELTLSKCTINGWQMISIEMVPSKTAPIHWYCKLYSPTSRRAYLRTRSFSITASCKCEFRETVIAKRFHWSHICRTASNWVPLILVKSVFQFKQYGHTCTINETQQKTAHSKRDHFNVSLPHWVYTGCGGDAKLKFIVRK